MALGYWDTSAMRPRSHLQPAERSRPLDTFKLHMVPRPRAARVVHEALFAIQDEDPETQVASVAILFAVVAKRCALDPEELYRMGLRMVTPEPGDETSNAQLEALRDYAGLRIMGQSVTIR